MSVERSELAVRTRQLTDRRHTRYFAGVRDTQLCHTNPAGANSPPGFDREQFACNDCVPPKPHGVCDVQRDRRDPGAGRLGRADGPAGYRDLSDGRGHCWRHGPIPADVACEIEGEIVDGGTDRCADYVADNGCHYRWCPAPRPAAFVAALTPEGLPT